MHDKMAREPVRGMLGWTFVILVCIFKLKIRNKMESGC